MKAKPRSTKIDTVTKTVKTQFRNLYLHVSSKIIEIYHNSFKIKGLKFLKHQTQSKQRGVLWAKVSGTMEEKREDC